MLHRNFWFLLRICIFCTHIFCTGTHPDSDFSEKNFPFLPYSISVLVVLATTMWWEKVGSSNPCDFTQIYTLPRRHFCNWRLKQVTLNEHVGGQWPQPILLLPQSLSRTCFPSRHLKIGTDDIEKKTRNWDMVERKPKFFSEFGKLDVWDGSDSIKLYHEDIVNLRQHDKRVWIEGFYFMIFPFCNDSVPKLHFSWLFFFAAAQHT